MTLDSEYNKLKQYKTKQFYDRNLGRIANYIVTTISEQKTLGEEIERSFVRQVRLFELEVDLAKQLCRLYDYYSFMHDNDAFYQTYIKDRASIENNYLAVKAIREDIIDAIDENGSWQPTDGDRSYMLMHNKTVYTISVKFTYKVYSEDETQFLYSDTYQVYDIPPHKDYSIYLRKQYDLSYSGTTTVYTDWEVTDIKD